MIKNCINCFRDFIVKRLCNKNLYCSNACRRRHITIWKYISFIDAYKRLEISFDKKVIKGNSCWGWNGCVDRNNYGYLSFFKKRLYAHRASWIIHNGFIEPGKFILHKCDNTLCSNPNHLFLGTQKDNINDMILKKRDKIFNRRKLNKDEVLKIKKLLNDGKSLREIGKLFNVSHSVVGDIKFKITYKEFL